MAENIPEFEYFSHDKEQLLNTIARFDDGLREEDVVGQENESDNLKQYSNTVLIQVLLEFMCHAIVKDENHREKLLMEACKRLSKYKIMNDLLILDRSNQLRTTMKYKVINFLKEICQDIIPDAELNSNAVQLFQADFFSTDWKLEYCRNFIELSKIAKGGFGSVYKVQYKLNKLIYAVKKIPFDYKTDANFLMVMREANNFAALNHVNIVRYYNTWIEMSESDFASNPSLNDVNVPPDSDVSDMTGEYSGIIIKAKSSRENSDDESLKSLRKNSYNSPKSAKSSDSVIFSESAEINTVINWPEGNFSQYSSVYSNEDTSKNYSQYSLEESSKDSSKSYSQNSSDESNEYRNESNCQYFVDQSNKDESNKPICYNDKEDYSFPNFKIQGMLYIQMEYCDCDLSFWLQKRAETKGKELPFEMDVDEIFTNIVKGVAHIHSRGIIHRDLKPHNIFYSRSCNTVKIGDFGLSSLSEFTVDSSAHTSRDHSSCLGTIPYSAPEQLKSKKYDMKVDIYSLGVILVELINICGTQSELVRILERIKGGKTEQNKDFPALGNLATVLISNNPKDRMSAKEILDFIDKDSKVIAKEVIRKEYEEKIKEKDEIIQHLIETISKYESIENNYNDLNDRHKKLEETLQKIQEMSRQENLDLSRLNQELSKLNFNEFSIVKKETIDM